MVRVAAGGETAGLEGKREPQPARNLKFRLDSLAGLQDLNAHLEDHSYIEG